MSSDDLAIRIENLSKCYQIYERPSDRLRQFVMPRVGRIIGRADKAYFRDFWAVKDVSFEVRRGDTVGIIGRNGSGKSTLLQIICGTLTPTSGTVETRGRVAALLELGAGFNPEFSGRENVYMNAALFGLTREQTDERFDAIAGFADIGQFIDQPVKTYSSGMYVRLAFAVIAHVDADILVVDEALSVGDAVFTQKCMRFIRAFQQNGTLLFVSHDMGSVQNLCKSSIWMGHGKVLQAGASKGVVESYLRHTLQEVYGDEAELQQTASGDTSNSPKEPELPYEVAPPVIDYESRVEVKTVDLDSANGWKTGVAEISSVTIERLDGETTAVLEGWERIRVVIRAIAHQDLDRPILGFILKDRLGQDLLGENTLPLTAQSPRSVRAGQTFQAQFDFRMPMLPNGSYALMASLANGDLYDNVQHHYMHDALILNVASSRVRWGLVGVPFEKIELEVIND
ncbi:MAG: ABC transporter ATP-binding protein [Alcaligenaceae bacterium]|nr:MAG: ABC transporter ATP-binding protein [Alcaligenaceae bacterium]